MTFGQAMAYVMSGMYGEVGIFNGFLLVVQLSMAGLIVIYLDELLQSGYGLGSGISLFIATNICENIIWKALSPITIKSDGGTQFEGALISLFHLLLTWKDKAGALYDAFYRANAPNMSNLLATFIMAFAIIYLQCYRVDITLVHRKIRGATNIHKIKLFYTSTFPIILQTAIIQNLYFFS
jgi:protein transport protein SEC61 subunit alpha